MPFVFLLIGLSVFAGGLVLAYETFQLNLMFTAALGNRGMGYSRHLTEILWLLFAGAGAWGAILAVRWIIEDWRRV